MPHSAQEFLRWPGGPERNPACYLWRNFATSGFRANEVEFYVPFGGGRYAVYSFRDYQSNGVYHLGRLKEGLPVLNTTHRQLQKGGVWSNFAAADAYGGNVTGSNVAGSTLEGTVKGHTLILRAPVTPSGGFATVAIDGDYTRANRLPQVTSAEVAAGYFGADDLGKRYLNYYGVLIFTDEHLVLADGLEDSDHTLRIEAEGTKVSESSGAIAYVTAFAAASAATSLTAPGASMGYTRDISNNRSPNSFPGLEVVPSFAPRGSTRSEFLGSIHGHESPGSWAFSVDGVQVSPASGEYITGAELRFERVTTLSHPSVTPAAVATKYTLFTCRSDRLLQ
ncbi:MAG TPA: hypothetical protein VK689_19235, partial [Armatimonadota bacterium]|nr:hypothetical protein [Armatimonadota bacterium]